MSVRTATAQEALENQDEDVLYNIDEVTGERTPLVPDSGNSKVAPKKGRPKKTEETPDESAAEGDGE